MCNLALMATHGSFCSVAACTVLWHKARFEVLTVVLLTIKYLGSHTILFGEQVLVLRTVYPTRRCDFQDDVNLRFWNPSVYNKCHLQCVPVLLLQYNVSWLSPSCCRLLLSAPDGSICSGVAEDPLPPLARLGSEAQDHASELQQTKLGAAAPRCNEVNVKLSQERIMELSHSPTDSKSQH